MIASPEEAAKWFAAHRRGVMTVDEQQSYRVWQSAPANKAALARLDEIWDSLGAAGAAKGRRRPVVRSRATERRRAIIRSALASMALAAVLAGAGSLQHIGPQPYWTELDWWSR